MRKKKEMIKVNIKKKKRGKKKGDIQARSGGERKISRDRAAMEVLEGHSITSEFLLRHGWESNGNPNNQWWKLLN